MRSSTEPIGPRRAERDRGPEVDGVTETDTGRDRDRERQRVRALTAVEKRHQARPGAVHLEGLSPAPERTLDTGPPVPARGCQAAPGPGSSASSLGGRTALLSPASLEQAACA